MLGVRRVLQASIFTAEVRNTGPGSVILTAGTGRATVLTPNTSAYIQLAEGEHLDAQSKDEAAILIVSADERTQGAFRVRFGDQVDVSDEDEKQFMRGAYAWRAAEAAANEFEGVQVFDGTAIAYSASDSPTEVEYDDVLQNQTFIGTSSAGIKRWDPINSTESLLDGSVTDFASRILPIRSPVFSRYVFLIATDDIVLYDEDFNQVSLENVTGAQGPGQFRSTATTEYVTFKKQFADEIEIIRLLDGQRTTVSYSSDYSNHFRSLTIGSFHYILSDNDEKCLAIDLRTGETDEIVFATGPANSVDSGNDSTGAWELDYDIPGEKILFFPHLDEYMRVPDFGFVDFDDLGLITTDGEGRINLRDRFGGRTLGTTDVGFADFAFVRSYDAISRHVILVDGSAPGDPVRAFELEIEYDPNA